MSQLTDSDFQTYDSSQAGSIVAGPTALYKVSLDSILPTQMDEGLAEVGKKVAGFDLLTPAQLQANLLTDIEPVVIGPDGKLYLLDGHHTFTALSDSIYGASNPTVYVNVVANYSSLTETQFFETMQANNLLLPLNEGVPETVDPSTGAPIPTSLTSLANDPYRGLEYSILKNKSSKLFTNGATTPGLDKMTGFYADFFEAAAYRDANNGLGLSYISPYDISVSTAWNLNGSNTTTLPNIAGTVTVAQLPGFILSQNLVQGSGSASGTTYFGAGGITNATLANGALAGDGTFTGITEINAGTSSNPIMIGTPNVGFILQLGADNKKTVTLASGNSYTGGTSILAGSLIITDNSSLGAATPANASIDPANVRSSVQAANGIIFDSLDEGNATLTIGTAAGAGAAFTTNRPIAVGGETATLNVNGYQVSLTGQLVSLGVDGVGIGNATGFSDLTIDDNSSNNGVLILSTASPYFYGDLIIGSTNKPTVRVMSDAAMGNTTGPADEIGEIVLNGGTFQAGASFNSVRTVSIESKSTFDTAGFTTNFAGELSDIQRNLTITNTGTGAGAVSFASFDIGAALELTLSKGSGTATTVTFTNGIIQSAASDQVLLAGLSSADKILYSTTPTLTDGILPPWILIDSAASNNPYDFATYTASGITTFAGYATNIATSAATAVIKQAANVTLSANAQAYALNLQKGFNITIGSGHTLTLGDGTSAGLIFNGGSGSGLTGGTLAFGAAQAYVSINGSSTITSAISGSGGFDLDGTGTLTVSAVSSETELVTVNSGTLVLGVANVFSADTQGLLLQDTKNLATANLTINANNQFAVLDSAGTNSTVTIANGSILTIGDSTNQSSTLSSAIKDTTATAGAITKAGTGLLDLSGGSVTLAAGSSIVINAGELRVATGALVNTAVAASAPAFVIASGAELQFAQNGGGQYAGAISGAGELHLIGGTLQLTGTANTYSGGTRIELGSTLDVTTANLSSANQNIVDAGGLVVFDQATSGTYSGVISDGAQMGTGPMESGSLDKDDSTGANAGNVTLAAVQTYSGATTIEAGTLTLGAVNTIASSSGVSLGRVSGGATATLALGADNQLAGLTSYAQNVTSVTLNGHVLTLTPGAGIATSFNGTILDGTGAGSLVIDGTGMIELGGANTFTGGINIESGTLELNSAQAAGTGAINFVHADVDPTLTFAASAVPTNAITNFGTDDEILITGFAASSETYSNGVLTLQGDNGPISLTISGDGLDSTSDFLFVVDSTNDTTTIETPCYCPGTLIATDMGERPVETLVIGDRLLTISGALQPIKWIGRRSYNGRFAMGRTEVLPICVKAGALGDNRPRRDLWISPHHAMYLDGVLIEARDLVNGVSIIQAERVESVTYIHVELDSHEVILAEGAWSESFLDDDNRAMFHNALDYAALYPGEERKPVRYAAPRILEGARLEAIRAAISVRAGLGQGTAAEGGLRGAIDRLSAVRIDGWAQNALHPGAPVCLDIFADGQLIGHALANRFRKDLAEAGLGSGHHAFSFEAPMGCNLARMTVEIRRASDGALLRTHALTRAA